MQDWPSVITGKRALLQALESRADEPSFTEESDDITRKLFRSICAINRSSKMGKVLTNFEVAAMQMSVHIQVQHLHINMNF